MENLWLKDINLHSIADKIDNYEIFSFDIFDTVIFRSVDKPKEIFEILYDEFRKTIYQECILIKEEFREMRILAEDKARINKKKFISSDLDPEVTLPEIYDEFKYLANYKEKLMKLELDIEKKNIFCNPVIYNLIEYLNKRNKKIIFISDMYLTKIDIQEILINAGINLNYIDNIFVSCEYMKSKNSGKLYKEVLDYYNLKSDEIFHIGDNEVGDVEGANINGIKYCHYDAISKKNLDIELEQIKFGITTNKINSLRKIVSNLHCDKSKEERFWFEIGTNVLGPFLTLFSQWVIDIAKKQEIKQIYPFMREGVILIKTLTQAAKYNDFNAKFKEIYISREATTLPSLIEVNKEFIDSFFLKEYLTVNELIKKLNLYVILKDDATFNELKEFRTTQLSQIDEFKIKKLIFDNVGKINEEIDNKRELLIKYLDKEIDFQKKFITVDLGFQGSIQRNLQKVFEIKNYDIQPIHLLGIGGEKLYLNLNEGLNIRAYVNYLDDNLGLTEAILWKSGIIEELMNDERGSTIGYKKVNKNNIVPILVDNMKPDKEIHYKEICQEGILLFQKIFYKVLYPKINVKNYLEVAKQGLTPVARLLEIPTLEEAENLLNLHHDENMWTDYLSTFISENDRNLVNKSKDYYEFMDKAKSEKVMWPQGVYTLYNPNEIMLKIAKSAKFKPRYFIECFKISAKLLDKKIDDVIIYGAGEVGITLVEVLQLCNIKVSFIIDKRETLRGKYINGVEIICLDDAKNRSNFSKIIVIASFSFIKEIRKTIENNFKNVNILEIK